MSSSAAAPIPAARPDQRELRPGSAATGRGGSDAGAALAAAGRFNGTLARWRRRAPEPGLELVLFLQRPQVDQQIFAD